MITSLLFTTTGNVILALVFMFIIWYLLFAVIVTMQQRKTLLQLINKTQNPIWPNQMKMLEDKHRFRSHIIANIMRRDWKDYYRPYFYTKYVNSRLIESDEP